MTIFPDLPKSVCNPAQGPENAGFGREEPARRAGPRRQANGPGASRTGQISYTLPYSSRPDIEHDDGPYNGSNSQGAWTCQQNCFHFDFLGPGDAGPSSAVNYNQMKDNRDLWTAYVGINNGLFQWVSDSNANLFPDEVADLLNNYVGPSDDCGAPV
ncbi:hypothetical protein, partial [Marinovum algicola]|uniref:hypothetical protein n=1 Tax=Marinovum algicola TaxID=42444 RepID=UPI0024B9BC62